MPSLSTHQSGKFTKLLLIGDSGSGKSGALASLVNAGYKLGILDYDNGLDSLKAAVMRTCPDKADNVHFCTLRDKRKATPLGSVIDGSPRAFIDGIKLMDHWKVGDEDLGPPAKWGPEWIFVLDSLTFFGDAAFDFREPLVPRSKDGKYDVRAVYKDAQDAVSSTLGLLTGVGFETNVIVTAHIRYMTMPDGSPKGQPTAIGQALGPEIPRYFNSTARCETDASGKRHIKTIATALIDLKNPEPFSMAPSYPIESGLADFFKVLRK